MILHFSLMSKEGVEEGVQDVLILPCCSGFQKGIVKGEQ